MSTVLTERSPRQSRTDRRRTSALAAAAILCLLVSACGSQLEPDDLRQVGGAPAVGQAVDTDGDGVVDQTVVPDGSPVEGDAPPAGAGAPDPGSSAAAPPPPGGEAPGGGNAPPAEVPADNAPTGDGQAGDCEGFKNQTGVTDSEITIANASDISGPVPGLFSAAQQGTKAFVAYYNATEKLCGRSLKVLNLDSRADAGADQQAYTQACAESFAAVGSVSSFDAGGAGTAQSCGLPDIRSFAVTPERQQCTTCYAAYAISSSRIAESLPKFWLQREPEASKHVGIFYVNVAAAKTNAERFAVGFEKTNLKVDLLQGIETAEFNYVPYVQQMKDKDLDFIVYFGPYQFAIRLQQAMQQQSFKPKVFLEDPTIYDATYVEQAGAAGDGSYVYSVVNLFDDTSIEEMKLYRAYLEQVAPGAVPNYYGLFAWSATRLFVEQATALGGKLTRASLVSALKNVKDWTGNGLHAPMSVGGKVTSPCIKVIQLNGTSWKQVSPGEFMCGALINTG